MPHGTLPKRCLIFLLGTLLAQHAVTSPAQWQSGNVDMGKARALHSAHARFESNTQPEMAQLSLLANSSSLAPTWRPCTHRPGYQTWPNPS